MDITDKEFDALQRYVRDACGIHVPPDKRYLIRQRLEPLVCETGCETFADFHELLSHEDAQYLRDEVVAAISTNETSFFRDAHPFRTFGERLLPWLGQRVKQRRRDQPANHAQAVARIWSAGASTGQEPYSLAILVHEYVSPHRYLGVRREDFSITATDISERALSRARTAAYHPLEVSKGLSAEQRERYFSQADGRWVVSEEIRTMVRFQKMNLMQASPLLPYFDIIFCRNVLIYFDEDTKRSVISRFHSRLLPGGYLVLGTAENLYCLSDRFESEQVGGTLLYRKPE